MAKRERSVNWEGDEKQLLREIIKPFLYIIENKDISTNTNKNKGNAWMQISNQFNSANKRVRDKKQIINQWKLIKLKSKKEITNHKRQIQQTGGGPRPPSPSPEALQILELLPQEFEVDYNELGCDGKLPIPKEDSTKIVPELINIHGYDEPSELISTGQEIPPISLPAPSFKTPKRATKKRKLPENTFNFGEASFEDMHKFRELENERHEKEHELRMKTMADMHTHIIKNLKLQEEILNETLKNVKNFNNNQ